MTQNDHIAAGCTKWRIEKETYTFLFRVQIKYRCEKYMLKIGFNTCVRNSSSRRQLRRERQNYSNTKSHPIHMSLNDSLVSQWIRFLRCENMRNALAHSY